jgi:tetratricopeptide (TPR) repeat protein
MTPEQKRTMIDHLDENLKGKATASLDDIIGNDPEAAKEWSYLSLAVETIQNAGLHQQVAATRATWRAGNITSTKHTDAHAAVLQTVPATETTSAKTVSIACESRVRTIYRYSLRAAAVMLIITSGTAFYKYLSVSSGSLYDRYYSGYDLSTSRGANANDAITDAYNAKDWNTVENIGDTAKVSRSNQTDFLAGMACLERKKYEKAINHFEQIIAVNSHSGTSYYQDEAEFYLAISWLAHQKINEAMPLLEKIRAEKVHKYHGAVEKMSFFDLRLAQYKENK